MSRARVVTSIVAKISDYRDGEIASIDPDHIDRWVSQFDEPVQVPILTELDHVLSKTYISRSAFETFFAEVVTSTDLVGDDPCGFWAGSTFFNKQLRGDSQNVLLELFSAALQQECGLSVADCGGDDGPLIYVDDAAYTGIHIINDLAQIVSEAPKHTILYMILFGVHNQGSWYATQQLQNRFRAAGKTVDITWFCELDLENTAPGNSDVLWPKSVPDQEEAKEYAASLTYPLVRRGGDAVGKNGFFSSGSGRHLLEQEFLKAGALIRSESPNLKVYARPLGNCVRQNLGFGAVIVTYRNCANNCPLVFWAGDHPLFPRNNN
jgi:hypothetical protein